MPPPQQPSPHPLRLDRRHPVARRVIASWRRLIADCAGESAGEPTLIACSGGADSIALALALASTGARLTLAFARHGARAEAEVDHDLRVVQNLAASIGAECVALDCVPQDGPSPTEGQMRRHRYAALAGEARRRGLTFVSSAHHADDQLETVLLALLRGAGPLGMAGVPGSRRLDDGSPPVWLLRPMLDITRAEIESLCRDAGVRPPGEGGFEWAEDRTNADTRYARNRIRHELAPLLEQMQPGVARRASRNAELFRQMADLLRARAEDCDSQHGSSESDHDRTWRRSNLQSLRPIEIGELLRLVVGQRFDRQGMDRLDGAALLRVAEAVLDGSTEPRRFELGDALVVHVRANTVTLQRNSPA